MKDETSSKPIAKPVTSTVAQPVTAKESSSEENGKPMEGFITPGICSIKDVYTVIGKKLAEHYNVIGEFCNRILDKHLRTFIDELKDDLYLLIEYPYVDKMYRDAYYNYYSSKLSPYFRNSIRISFFDSPIKYEDFREPDNSKLKDHYGGFLVLRPTFPKIIGRSAISPRIKKENRMTCCLAKINATAGNFKFKVPAFPHASQDNQTITCAETTIWSMMEYFGNKFPDHKPVLPSAITRLLHKFSYKRLIPSDGLTAEQVTYCIRELGFGAVIYSKQKFADDFESIISTYIESGIPVIGVLQTADEKLGHAINIIGREEDDLDAISKEPPMTIGNNVNIIDYNKFKRRFVFVDDNYPPYQLAHLDKPCSYYATTEKLHDCELKSIIVPLHSRIYLDGARARQNFYKVLSSSRLGIKDTETRVLNTFLCASRSYKEYIAQNKELHRWVKELILSVPMPKFIWVAEVSKLTSITKNHCDGFLIQDATEPLEYSDKTMLNSLILTGYMDETVFRQSFGKFQEITTFASSFEAYKGNIT